MVVLDTSIIIDHLRQPPEKSKLIKMFKISSEDCGLSLVSVQELYEGESTKKDEEERYLLSTLTQIEILPYTYDVAKLAGQIARDLGRPIDLADAAIAATAILNGAQLFTLNKKDFQGIKNLEFLVKEVF